MGEALINTNGSDKSIEDCLERQKSDDRKILTRLIAACSIHPSNRDLELERRKYKILSRCSEIRYETYIIHHRETSPTKQTTPQSAYLTN